MRGGEKMTRRSYLPILFVIALLVASSIACNGGGSGSTSGQPREMKWGMADGELTSHALDRWAEAFPTCYVVRHAANVGGVNKSLTVWYSCQADQ